MKHLLKIITFGTVLSTSLLASAAMAATNPLSDACKNAPNSSICQQAGGITPDSVNPVGHTLNVAADIIALVAAIAAIIIIIIAGFSLITSNGNAEATTTARNRIIYAVVGLIIVAMAWSIVTLLVDRLIK